MQVLRDLAGQLNPQEAQAMMHRLDPNNSGKFTFERLLEVGRNIKLQRKQGFTNTECGTSGAKVHSDEQMACTQR